MNKEDFLSNPDVHGFIQWLAIYFDSGTFRLKILPSRFVPGGLIAEAHGIEEVLKYYCWKAKWTDSRSGQEVESATWLETKVSLGKLSQWLQESVKAEDEGQAYAASRAVLQWGGVSGASKLLKKLCGTKELVAYLLRVQRLLAVNGPPTQKIQDITAVQIKKFDSGLTKIHALLDGSGSPIYDSRVAGAVSLLYTLYRETCPRSLARVLEFPCGSARGDQLRNPGDLGFKRAKALYFETAHHEWAQVQLKLGWIFWGLLIERPKLFEKEGDFPARAHALEASLFMLGYDLRCFSVLPSQVFKSKTSIRTPKGRNLGMVPTVHPFKKVVNEFTRIRLTRKSLSQEDFLDLMFEDRVLKSSTRKAYLFPLKATEFDLFEESEVSIKELEKDSFHWLMNRFGSEGFELSDERRHICLIDAWLVGYLNRHFVDPSQHAKMLEVKGFAGSLNAANAILEVGRSVGKFFNLLDQNHFPTTEFDQFYRDMNDLENELKVEVARI